MSVSLYMYEPDICDGDFCPGDCDYCSKRFDAEEKRIREEEEENAD